MPTDTRAAELIARLELQPHPEGGYFREVFRSASTVQAFDSREERSAVTTIYFLLKQGQFSRLHQITSDEIWHYYEGAPLELTWGALNGGEYQCRLLGPVAANQSPVLIVPAGDWQAARSTGAYTLVGCSVAPGFEFQNFRMLSDVPAEADAVRSKYPELHGLIGGEGR